jgi:hypothetical protein
MKKTLIMTVLLCVAAVCGAQEAKGGFMAEVGLGFSKFGNYAPVSVFVDPTEAYSMIPSEHFTLGYRFKSNMFLGLNIGTRGGNTSFRYLDENFFDIDIMAEVRRIFPLGHRFEFEAGAALGYLLHGNAYKFGGNTESASRGGFSCHVLMGVNYRLSEKTYIGLHAQLPYYANIGSDGVELPAGLTTETATTAPALSGYSLQASVGIRF